MGWSGGVEDCPKEGRDPGQGEALLACGAGQRQQDDGARQIDCPPDRILDELAEEHLPRVRPCGIVASDGGGDRTHEVVEDAREDQGHVDQDQEHGESNHPLDNGPDPFAQGLPRPTSPLLDRQEQRGAEDHDVGAKCGREGGQQRGDQPTSTARPGLRDQQGQGHEGGRMPLALRDRIVVESQVIEQEHQESDRPRQGPPADPAGPGHQDDAERHHESGVEGIDRPGLTPAEQVAQDVKQVGLAGEAPALDVAVGQEPLLPGQGLVGEVVEVRPPRPGQVVRDPPEEQDDAGQEPPAPLAAIRAATRPMARTGRTRRGVNPPPRIRW